MRKTVLIILSCSLIAACAVNRFESIAPCEFEVRSLAKYVFWDSTNCLEDKDVDSHPKKAIDEVKGV